VATRVCAKTAAHLCLKCVHHSELRQWRFRRIDHDGPHNPVSILRDAGEWGHGRGISPCPFKRGPTGVEMSFHNSITGNVMVDQDRLETNLLQLFTHPESSGWFSIISVIISLGQHCWWTETNVFGNDFLVFYKFPLPSTLFTDPMPYRLSGVPVCSPVIGQDIPAT